MVTHALITVMKAGHRPGGTEVTEKPEVKGDKTVKKPRC
jgi:hypothetical protein